MQAAINEKCLELGKKKSKPTKLDADENPVKKSKKSGCGCPYNKPAGRTVDIDDFSTDLKSGYGF